jgi:hypothetical protein
MERPRLRLNFGWDEREHSKETLAHEMQRNSRLTILSEDDEKEILVRGCNVVNNMISIDHPF